MRLLAFLLVAVAFVGCPKESKEHAALMEEYHRNVDALRRYAEMKPLWKKLAENDEMPMQAYLDSLQAEIRLIRRQDSIVYRLNTLDAKVPIRRERRR